MRLERGEGGLVVLRWSEVKGIADFGLIEICGSFCGGKVSRKKRSLKWKADKKDEVL
jgi:hypothetical protein